MAKGRKKSKRTVKRVDPDAKKAEIEAAKAEEADESVDAEEEEGAPSAEDETLDSDAEGEDFDESDDDDDEAEPAAAASKSLADLSPAERRAERRRRRIERRAKERAKAAGESDAIGEVPEPTEVNTAGGLIFVGIILALLAGAVVVAFLTK